MRGRISLHRGLAVCILPLLLGGCALWEAPSPPTVAISAIPQSGTAPLEVRLVGDSTDATIIDWRWDVPDTDGGALHGSQVACCFERSGTYVVEATATDRDGLATTASLTIDVLNTAPLASCRFSSDAPLVDAWVTFDASGSIDADGTIAAVLWEFGDGEMAHGSKVSHAYAEAGVYVVRVTVTDNLGATASAEHEMTVCLPTPPGGGCCGGGSVCL